jgi:7tm Chemosensory receptor
MCCNDMFSGFLLIFQLSGLCMVRHNHRFKSLRIPIVQAISALIVVSLCLILLVARWKEAKIFHNETTVGKFTDIIQFIGPIAALFVCLLETVLKRKDHSKLLRSWTTMDALMGVKRDMSSVNRKFLRTILVKFAILHCFSLIHEITIIYRIRDLYSWFVNWCLKWMPIIFCRLADSQLIFYIELLRSRCEAFNCLLQGTDRNKRRHIRSVKRLWSEMVMALKYTNRRFGNSVVMTVISNFICLTVAVFFVGFKLLQRNYTWFLGCKHNIEATILEMTIVFSSRILFARGAIGFDLFHGF